MEESKSKKQKEMTEMTEMPSDLQKRIWELFIIFPLHGELLHNFLEGKINFLLILASDNKNVRIRTGKSKRENFLDYPYDFFPTVKERQRVLKNTRRVLVVDALGEVTHSFYNHDLNLMAQYRDEGEEAIYLVNSQI